MDQLPKLVAHSIWANRAWLQFIVDKAASDDWLLRRLSHIMLGERAWFHGFMVRNQGEISGLCSRSCNSSNCQPSTNGSSRSSWMESRQELFRSSDSQVRGTSLRSEISSFTWRFTGLTIVGRWRLTRQRSGLHPSTQISSSTVAFMVCEGGIIESSDTT